MAGSDARPFLTAEWKHLALISYAIDPQRIESYLPEGCIADTRDEEAFVSLVAFDFLETRVKGVRWPGFVNFPEINLRSYVRAGDRRGVVFIRELVPSRIVAWIARRLYNEPYSRAKMKSTVSRGEGLVSVEHEFRFGGDDHRVFVTAADEPTIPGQDSDEHFFKEHDLGVGRRRSGQPLHYQVSHPIWRTFPVLSHEVEVDFGVVYGAEWAFLNQAAPRSVVLAEGSEIAVYPAS